MGKRTHGGVLSRSRINPASWAGRATWRMREWVKTQPWLYLKWIAHDRLAHDGTIKSLSKRTELVIDAFPRSGNTYAVHAFRWAQEREVEIAHHLHAPALIIEACRLGLPTLSLLRCPEDAIASLATARDKWDFDHYLYSYINYYDSIRSCRSRFVLARFETVVHDFGSVVSLINRRFGTSFLPFETASSNVEAVHEMARMAANRRFRPSSPDQVDHAVAAPSEGRSTRIRDAKEGLMEQAPSLFEKARSVYERELADADI